MFRPGPILAGVCFASAVFLSPITVGAAEKPCVVELFTSQGCSSCPPADALLAELSKQPGVLTLSLPVDYWDYIGWKDTLASPAFTARQKSYAWARGDNQVYTPQAVVDGLHHVVGSDKMGILEVARTSYGEKGAMSVPVDVKRDKDRLLVDVGGAPSGVAPWGTFWLLQIAKSRTIAIGRGENKGRTITYTNVVRDMKKIGEWSGKPTHYEIATADLQGPDSDAWALMLQASESGKPGAILAVAKGGGL